MVSDQAEEEFLSLEDDIEPISKRSFRFSVPKNSASIDKVLPDKMEPIEVIKKVEPEIVIADYGGIHEMSWQLTGMDCPDCAMKAEKALGRLKQVEACSVSAIDARIDLTVNLENGSLSGINTVLRSLGNSADVPYLEILGVRAKSISERYGIEVKRLPKLLKRQPGILDVEITDGGRILVQLVKETDRELLDARERALSEIIGRELRLGVASSTRISSDQWRLIAAGIAFPMFV